MPEFIATYDLKETSPKPHGPFKEIARAKNWFGIVYDSKTGLPKSLPNTTLSLTVGTMPEAVASFANVVKAAEANILNFHIENVTIVGGGEVRAYEDGEAIRY